jgi:hypothetical protein
MPSDFMASSADAGTMNNEPATTKAKQRVAKEQRVEAAKQRLKDIEGWKNYCLEQSPHDMRVYNQCVTVHNPE